MDSQSSMLPRRRARATHRGQSLYRPPKPRFATVHKAPLRAIDMLSFRHHQEHVEGAAKVLDIKI